MSENQNSNILLIEFYYNSKYVKKVKWKVK